MSRSSIYRLMKAREFPLGVRIGPKTVRWRASVITAWVDSRPAAGDECDPADSV